MLVPGQTFASTGHVADFQDCPFAARQLSLEQVKDVLAARPSSPRKSNKQDKSGRPTSLCRATLSGMNLAGMELSALDLHAADLTKANLSGSILKGANLSGAKLSNAKS
jgi:uncharacterized protein YjbI with pentapeptide repeats